MSDLHLVFTDYEQFGFSLSSPQIPGLAAGRDSVGELLSALPRILEFAGAAEGFERTWLHEQKVAAAPDGTEYLVRFCTERSDDRHEAVGRILGGIDGGLVSRNIGRQPKLVTTERLIIATIDDDGLGWCFDQLWPGEGATLQGHAGDEFMYSVPISDGKLPGTTWELADLGLTRSSTVLELHHALLAKEVAQMSVSIHS